MSEQGERMLIPYCGGPGIAGFVRFLPPLEIEIDEATYVFADDGPVGTWYDEFVAVTQEFT